VAELLAVPGLQRTTNRFRWALVNGAEKRGLNPSYIAAVISLESGFRPNIRNQQGAPAMGLLQFWRDSFPPLARKVGQPDAQWEDLARSSALQQVPFVLAAFQGRKLATPTDYYVANFLPVAVGKPADFELGREGSEDQLEGTHLSKGAVYRQNAGLDANGDGVITVSDVGSLIEGTVDQARARPPIQVTPEPVAIPSLHSGTAAMRFGWLLVAAAGAYVFFRTTRSP